MDWHTINEVLNGLKTAKELLSRKVPTAAAPTARCNRDELVPDSYQVALGKRHRLLRENILQLNTRRMADLYGFEKASRVEDCERGIDEFSSESMQRLVQTFFVSTKFIQEGETPIFRSFGISYPDKECRLLLERGFVPTLFCSPEFRRNGYVFVVLFKYDEGYSRAIRSDTVGGLYSSGGGRLNIQNVIVPMIDLDIHWGCVRIVDADEQEWLRLTEGNWYEKEGPLRTTNWDAQRIFGAWYEETHTARRQWLARQIGANLAIGPDLRRSHCELELNLHEVESIESGCADNDGVGDTQQLDS